MHVGINAQLLNTADSYRSAGVSNYSAQLLRHLGALARKESDLSLTAFVNVTDFEADGIQFDISSLPLHHPQARIAWEQAVLPRLLQQHECDLVHGLVNVLPLTTSVPGVVTVHDLSFVRFPETLPRFKRAYLTRLCRASVHRARRVIAVSQQTADDLLAHFDVDANKIDVIHNGVGDEFSLGSPEAVEAFRRAKGLPERFILFVGTLEPRKNLVKLVQAFARWKAQAANDDLDVTLVLAGGKGWYYDQIFQAVHELGLEQDVRFPGFVPTDELPNWYRAAEIFIYPSRFEGFGLPILEAMACGTPVICSDAASLVEVAGDAALIVPADSEIELSAKMARLIAAPDERSSMQASGLKQADRFAWTTCARETYDVYTSTLANSART